MERHRCTHCRNPIRNLAVSRPGATESEWYHPDCWAAVCGSEQKRYEEQVREDGLSALLAPYLHGRSADSSKRSSENGVEQQQS